LQQYRPAVSEDRACVVAIIANLSRTFQIFCNVTDILTINRLQESRICSTKVHERELTGYFVHCHLSWPAQKAAVPFQRHAVDQHEVIVTYAQSPHVRAFQAVDESLIAIRRDRCKFNPKILAKSRYNCV